MPIWSAKQKNTTSFKIENPHRISDFYFPLTNTNGDFYSSISPFLSGDIKKNQNEFLTYPATIYDLKSLFCIRTLWLKFKNTALNISPFWKTKDKIILKAGPLWHQTTRINKKHNLSINTLNFIPEKANVEIMWIKIKNRGKEIKTFVPTTSIPLFCRSENNLRNHRHVTSLLNRAKTNKNGIVVNPTMYFDERGHKRNTTSYFVYAYTDQQKNIQGVFSTLEEFCGKEGNLYHPESVYSNLKPGKNKEISGKENFAGIQFKPHKLLPQKDLNICIIMGIEKPQKINRTFKKFDTVNKVNSALEENKKNWTALNEKLQTNTNNPYFDFWLKWVNLQPELRKRFGCSFLPHFDYGKGGKGWRDLWQDILPDVIMNPKDIKGFLLNNFKGIRIDGSNATIITQNGNFLSDRDKISRVWTDHGVWPFLILKEYIERTGDYKTLFHETSFFRDNQLKRSQEKDTEFSNEKFPEFKLKDKNGRIYKSSILDHLLIQNLVQFFNVGPKGNTKLENADWNDALDMAPDKGESVAFTNMYAYNFKKLAELLRKIQQIDPNIKTVQITANLTDLISNKSRNINHCSPKKKQKILESYFEKTKDEIKQKKKKINLADLVKDLLDKYKYLSKQINKKEWLPDSGIYNGYYDNNSKRVEGKTGSKINIMLPSQTFPIISGIADKTKIEKIWKQISKRLRLKNSSAFKLNTDFKSLKLNLGRAFAFSYGDKENGSVFSHMNILMAYGLYKQGFAKKGYKIFSSLFELSTSKKSQIAPCIPEYFNLKKKGLYPYLTGSASWLIYTFISQICGISFDMGKLVITPCLLKEQFSKKNNNFEVQLNISGTQVKIIYRNINKKQWPDYKIKKLILNKKIIRTPEDKTVRLTKTETTQILNSKKSELKLILN